MKRTVYKFKTKPYPHQVKALKSLLKRRPQGGALLMPMRTGKTKVAIDFANCLELKGLIDRVLVVCPLSVKSVWRKQVRIHSPDTSSLRWRIVNYEATYERQRDPETREWWPVESQALREYCRGHRVLIIVDESHKIGKASSRQATELYNLAKEMGVRHRVIMTGTPFHRGKKLLIFGQFKFLDVSVFGSSFKSFKERYSRHGGFGGYVLMGYLRQKEFRKKVARKSFVMARVPKVPTQHTIWSYPLEESDGAYTEMAEESLWKGIEAPNPLVKATRLSQIASGRIKTPTGRVLRVGYEKQRSWEGLLEQLHDNGHERIVVFSRWLAPMVDVAKVARKWEYDILPFHGGVDPDLRERRIDYFQDPSRPPSIFLSQTATGALGIELSAASVAVFYTLPSGLVDYDQDLARIQLFHERRTLSYYYLVGEGTVEEAHLASLRGGIEFTEALTRHPDLLNYKVVA